MLQDLIKEAIAREEKYQATRRAEWKLVKKLGKGINGKIFPEGTKVYFNPSSITIRVPWGVDNLRQARIAMGDGWQFSANYTEDSGTLSKSYHQYGEADATGYRCYISLSLIMDASELNEESCKRIEIGEKTFTQKQYKVICADHVTEMRGQAEEVK